MSEELDYCIVPNFSFYRSFYEAIELLDNDTDKLHAFQAITKYGFTGFVDLELLSPTAKMIVIMAMPNVENSVKFVLNGMKSKKSPKTGATERTEKTATKPSKIGAEKTTQKGSSKGVSSRGLVERGEQAKEKENREKEKEKNGIEEEIEKRESPPPSTQPHSDLDSLSICQNFNTICYRLTPLESMTAKQKENTEAFLETYGMAKLSELFHLVGNSDFLCGSKEFTASYDWIIKLENAEKIFSGKYGNNEKKPTSSSGSAFIQYAEEQMNQATAHEKGNPDGINTNRPQAP